jgi:thiamine-monophosphate kinase
MTAPRRLGEFGRIAEYFRPLAAGFPGALDLTDDAATIEVPVGHELVVTTDAVVAGVHFLPSDAPEDVARKALRVNLSDLAAKGARPLVYTLALALTADVSDGWVARFAGGLAEDQLRYGIALAGGDSVSTAGPIWASITAMGLVETGRMVRRSGARPGDRVLVTGSIGDAALGLLALTRDLEIAESDRAALAGRYRLPEPRTALAPAIARWAHAAIDISDGLAADFGHLCRASRMTGTIIADRVPLSPSARRALLGEPDRLADILGGGDDYEVLMAAPADALQLLAAAAGAAGIALTEIGEIAAGDGRANLIGSDGLPMALGRVGWTHS